MPGMEADPFVDYREKIRTVSRDQQANIMGRSNLAMVESGLVKWDDVVTPTRIRDLREVVSRKKLTVNQMVASGVKRGRAEEAFNSVSTNTHTAKEARRQELVKKILAKGFTRQQILDAAGRSIGSRISTTPIPTSEGQAALKNIPSIRFATPGPKAKAAIARAAAMKPKGEASAALTQIQSDKSGRLKLTADGMRNFLGGIIKGLREKFGVDVKPVASADMSAPKEPIRTNPARSDRAQIYLSLRAVEKEIPKDSGGEKLVPIHAIRDHAEVALGRDIPREIFDRAVRDLAARGTHDILAISDFRNMTIDQLKRSIHDGDWQNNGGAYILRNRKNSTPDAISRKQAIGRLPK